MPTLQQVRVEEFADAAKLLCGGWAKCLEVLQRRRKLWNVERLARLSEDLESSIELLRREAKGKHFAEARSKLAEAGDHFRASLKAMRGPAKQGGDPRELLIEIHLLFAQIDLAFCWMLFDGSMRRKRKRTGNRIIRGSTPRTGGKKHGKKRKGKPRD